MADSDLWRASHLGHRVFAVFDDEQIKRLEERIEPVGFRDDHARAKLPELIRNWAFFWLSHIDEDYRGQKSLKRKHASIKINEMVTSAEWEKTKKLAQKLRQSIESLPRATQRFMIEYLTEGPRATCEDILQAWPGGRNPLAHLRHTLQRLEAASPPLKGRGGPQKPYSAAVKGLAPIWTELTGQKASSPYSAMADAYNSPFNEFATEAALALWPEARSVDGILKRI